MAKDPAFLFYPGDWLGGTMGMTFEEKGAYLELLILQFNKDKFTEAHAKHMLSTCNAHVWDVVKQKFATDGSFFWNERLEKEKAKRKNFCNSRRNNALGSQSPDEKEEASAEHMQQHMENENINEIIDYLNKVCGSDYRATTESTRRKVNGRIKDGYSVQDFKLVIDDRKKEWGADQKMKAYLRPETLFAPSKFEDYLVKAKSKLNGSQKKEGRDDGW